MTSIIGQSLLICLCIVAFCQSILRPNLFARLSAKVYSHIMVIGVCTQAYLALATFSTLVYAYLVGDFSITNVFFNSHSLTPFLYKISGAWSNHEGSLLLWLVLLCLYLLAFCIAKRHSINQSSHLTLRIMSSVIFGFGLFIFITSNPFTKIIKLPINEGLGMNPMLQDPLQAIHPPTLYLGYVGALVPFAITSSHMLLQSSLNQIAKDVHYWTLWAFGWLTAGIALGSIWAYYELGWGGWWFWDPVENASLLPWLATLGLIHGVYNVKLGKNSQFFLIFALLPFILSLVGTFIVRSGFITSVHAFADDPSRGLGIMAMIIIAITYSIYCWLKYNPKHQMSVVAITSRSGLITIFYGVLFIVLLTIIIATISPPLASYFFKKAITLGPPYFNQTIVPMSLGITLIIGIIGYVPWRSAFSLNNIQTPLSIFLILVVCYLFYLQLDLSSMVFYDIFILFALWTIIVTILSYKRLKLSVIMSHVGFAIIVLAMAAQTKYAKENITYLKVGQNTTIGEYRINLKSIDMVRGSNYIAHQAVFNIYRKNILITHLTPEHRAYPVKGIIHNETSVKPLNILHNIYIALGQEQEDKSWVVRIYYHPFVNLIWLGALLIFLTILITCSRRWFCLNNGNNRPHNG